jgi:hypothetical protein
MSIIVGKLSPAMRTLKGVLRLMKGWGSLNASPYSPVSAGAERKKPNRWKQNVRDGLSMSEQTARRWVWMLMEGGWADQVPCRDVFADIVAPSKVQNSQEVLWIEIA